jgi:O-succinylbenzoic acid--CoA ligase
LLPPESHAERLLEVLAGALDGTGPAVLPVDPRLPPARVRALLGAFGPATLETPNGSGSTSLPRQPLAPGTAVVIVTSGSTGEPKATELTAAALRHSAQASMDRIGASSGAAWLSCLPPSHIAGLQVFIRSLLAGVSPVVASTLEPRAVLEWGCRYVSLVPAQVRRLLDIAAGPECLASFGRILLGGAAVPAGLLAEARAAGARVTTTYGMTETCGGCVYDGLPLDGVSVRAGPDGRIQIAGPVLFSGYLGQPGLTEASRQGDWFVTSDLGEVDAEGRLIVRGRADGMINTGGEKVAADEVAAVLESFPGVREAVVVGRPDQQWGEIVTAVVVPADPALPPALGDLRGFAAGKLPPYAAPRALVLVDAIPLLPSGKPDLQEVRILALRA